MLKQCQDSYSTQFTQFPAVLAYHEETRKASLWERTEVNRLRVAALDKASPLYEDPSSFDSAVSQEAIADTAENLGLAIQVGERYFPLRDTAYKSLLDRAKINGTALPKLARAKLAEVLNSCLELHKDSALLLIRDEKVSAAHSGPICEKWPSTAMCSRWTFPRCGSWCPSSGGAPTISIRRRSM